MDNFHLDNAFNIGIELVHYEINIETEVELPAFFDHRIPEDIPELDRVDIVP